MKYKILISGKNNTIIDDFFSQMSDDFEAVTTSNRYDDMIRHLSFYKPDVFVYCISGESRDNINQLINAKFRMMETRIPIVLIGAKEECDEVERIAINLFDLTLYRPISIPAITARISKLLEGRPRMEAQKPSFEPEAIPPGIFASKSLSPSVAAQLGGAMANRGRKHVLVVDDNSMMLKLIKEYLHETYDVATAVSGKIAMKFLERRMTNLILLDYEMPGENGPAVLEQLRANEATKDIPVVFLTGVTETKKIQEALMLKPQSYLLKPVNREKLLSTIESLIQ
ncbi:MAG: response regulator [Lachnospiraceae bacterium]|jgi:CheY-like chemotaxis protein|nr:response regulator [Lachnospiraceae bacterium]